jgi:hypothetical protein
MPSAFQDFITMSDAQPLSITLLAAQGPSPQPERSQFSLLVRHFLERFFNHESASPDGDAKSRLILLAFTTGLPGLMVAMYLWPVYHPFIAWPPGRPLDASAPPYWLQVNHHLSFVLFSFVAMGFITIFEWDLFFPDLLDVHVFTALPVPDRRLFLARVTAISIFIVGFLFDANILGLLVLPIVIDPPSFVGAVTGQLLAVAGSGMFAATFVLALEAALLATLGERLLRKVILTVQGLLITVFLMLLLLFPTLSGAVPFFLQSGSSYALYFPPFWFLGIYQRLLEGPSALPIYSQLAQIGGMALLLTAASAALLYPVAYFRRVRQLVEGPGTRHTRNWFGLSLNRLLHVTLIRLPIQRAVFHLISQTIARVTRYRIYLVLYGGVGVSVVIATIFRVTVVNHLVVVKSSADGIRSAIGIVSFWTIAGLCTALDSPGNQNSSWVFRAVHGPHPRFAVARDMLSTAKRWVLLWGLIVTLGACFAFYLATPPEFRAWQVTGCQLLVGSGACLLLADFFFLNVTTLRLTGGGAREQSSLAATVLTYIVRISVVIWLSVLCEVWIEKSVQHFIFAAIGIAAAHLLLQIRHRALLRECCNALDPEDYELEAGYMNASSPLRLSGQANSSRLPQSPDNNAKCPEL